MPLRSALAACLLATLALPTQAATITVDSGTDDGVGCTLREAVEAANTDTAVGGCTAGSGRDRIELGVSLITLTGAEIVIAGLTDIVPASGRAGVLGAVDQRLFRITGGTVRFFRVDLIGGGDSGSGAADGGALRIEGAASVEFLSGRIRNHSAPTEGGAIWVGADAQLHIEDSVIQRNIAYGPEAHDGGGAVYTEGGPVAILRTKLQNNRAVGAAGSGGAILALNDADVSLTGGQLTRNRAARAGGAIEIVGGTLTLDGINLIENRAGGTPGNGGGVHAAGGAVVTGSNGSFDRNAASGEGGGLWVGAGSSAALTTFDIVNNRAAGGGADQGGGGVYIDGGDFSASDAFFVGNLAAAATGAGGGLFLNDGTATIGGGSLFLENKADRAGGAIAVEAPSGATLTLTESELQGNRVTAADARGAGIHTGGGPVALHLDDVVLTRNVAKGAGGGIWAGADTDGTFTMLSVTNNRALGTDGGGIYLTGGPTTILASTLSQNRAAGSGAGVRHTSGALVMNDVHIRDNVAASAGGGLATSGGTADLTRTMFVDNRSVDRGGAIAVGPDANVHALLARFEGNRSGLGGAFASTGGLVSIRESSLVGNAATDGGGVHQVGGRVIVAASAVTGNTAAGFGGGVYGSDGASVSVFNATLHGNGAERGGGLASSGADVEIEATTLAENRASTEGGGLYNDHPGGGATSPVSLRSTLVADNHLGGPSAVPDPPTGEPNLFGGYDTNGNNLIGTVPAASTFDPRTDDLVGVDPQLGPLADNGGPTQTAALAPGSPALDTGDTTFAFDQRGFLRSGGGADDIGSFELGATDPNPPTGATAPAALAASSVAPQSLTVAPNPMATRATVRFTLDVAQSVATSVYDATGRRVRELYSGRVEAGQETAVAVDVAGLATGVYVVVVEGEAVRLTHTVTVVR
ncbi:choice-of-anchor Q domain-containing protein [Rubrivirga sp. IMCC45206]|uniref:choice-of-anchor Q domain-containing protein n=1 Tax=Rubrivirga sp. IMCC45206 TaxID=3391614 RepID=UPI00398FC7C9